MSQIRQKHGRVRVIVMDMTQLEKARLFKDMHAAGTFVLPNAWDAASAALLAKAGSAAIATTSSGVSWAHGVPDGECLSQDEAIAALARIVHAAHVPVSADLEGGYGPTASAVVATIEAAMEAGAVGANLEDRLRSGQQVLRPIAEQCERLAAARAAADRTGIPFVLNARTDVFLVGMGQPEERETDVLQRALSYRDAGADCLFVPGLKDLATIKRLIMAVPLPLNILLAPGAGPPIADLAEAGVRRVSTGHTIAATAYASVRSAAAELLECRDEALRETIPVSDMNALLT
jgi:2-methylisocitrate lyase-like PEP mutase family enzyme